MTAFLYLTIMKSILTVCSLLLLASAAAQTDVTYLTGTSTHKELIS